MELEKFVLHKNKYKNKDNHPDYVVNVRGKDGWRKVGACWMKESESGKYLSCSVREDDDSWKAKKQLQERKEMGEDF